MKKFSLKKLRRLPRYQQFLAALMVIAAAFVIWLITQLTPRTAGVSLKITVDCDSIRELRCDFSLGGKELCTLFGGVEDKGGHAPFERGEVVSMNIPAMAFEDNNNMARLRAEKLGFELYVLGADGEVYAVSCEGAEFYASLGGKYPYTLTCENGEYRLIC